MVDTEQPDNGAEPVPTNVQTIATPTGLTPDQVFQEFKKSGFLDQLRRQMFDAYVSTTAQSQAVVPNSAVTPVVQADEAISVTPATSSTNVPLSASIAPELSTSTATSPSELGSKQALTLYLDTILRPQLEKEHDRLRFQDPRNQLDTLLKFLDSEPVAAAQAGEQEATLYEQLTAHVAKQAAHDTATKGILHKQGRVGKEVTQRISELIANLRNPSAKTGDDEEDEDDDDDDDKTVDQSTNHTADNGTVDMDI